MDFDWNELQQALSQYLKYTSSATNALSAINFLTKTKIIERAVLIKVLLYSEDEIIHNLVDCRQHNDIELQSPGVKSAPG